MICYLGFDLVSTKTTQHVYKYRDTSRSQEAPLKYQKQIIKQINIRMWFTTIALFSLLCHLATASPMPLPDPPNFFYKPFTLTFHGGPASYQLSMAADGNTYATNNAMAVSIIDSPDFDAYNFCNFYTTGQKAIVASNSNHELTVGPPQPIISVSCAAFPGGNNTCLPVYGMCLVCRGGEMRD
jgi:hypothetical protein